MKSARNVYFIKPVGLDGPIKIGCSEKPAGRLETLSVWSPMPLELIGSVPGTFEDERFLHYCFSEYHSHREWFRSSPQLRETIREILTAGTVDVVRDKLTPVGMIRQAVGRAGRTDEQKRCVSYKMRVIWTEKRIRLKGERAAWHAPADVAEIINNWSERISGRGNMLPPSDEEMRRLDQYLANPTEHSVHPPWHVVSGGRASA
jgi:hypothetical protein